MTEYKSVGNAWSTLIEYSLPVKDFVKKEEDFLLKNIKNDSKIMDIGCGNGRIIKLLAQTVKEIVGIDTDTISINECKKRFSSLKNLKLFKENALRTHFEDSEFDYCIISNLLYNLGETKQTLLHEAIRTTKPLGKIIISVYSENALEARLKGYKEIGLECKVINSEGVVEIKVNENEIVESEQFSKSDLIELCKQINQSKIEIIPLNEISYMLIITVTK